MTRVVSRRPVTAAVAGLLALVAVGSLVLLLPGMRADGVGPGGPSAVQAGHSPLLVAVFTATSAACAGGLTVVDTSSYWSQSGHVVLLVLTEAGGLGAMIVASLLALTVASRLGLSTRLLAGSESGGVDRAMVLRVARGSVAAAGAIQGVGALVLTVRLWTAYDLPLGRAAWWGLAQAVSATSNSGLVIGPGDLEWLAPDPLALAVLTLSFVLGGLGYPVLREVSTVRPARRWSLHTKVTLLATGVLAVLGPVAVGLSEWANPATLGRTPTGARVMEAIFSGLTPRTAGLTTFHWSQARPATRLVADTLMVIGGGSGGTAGGIKVTTVAVLVLAVVAEVRGVHDVEVLHRRIGSGTVRQAIAVAGLSAGVVAAGTLVVLPLTNADLDPVLFEVSSAFGTAGLTTGITASLPAGGQLAVAALMLVGRVGPAAVATALALRRTRTSFRYPEARPAIG